MDMVVQVKLHSPDGIMKSMSSSIQSPTNNITINPNWSLRTC